MTYHFKINFRYTITTILCFLVKFNLVAQIASQYSIGLEDSLTGFELEAAKKSAIADGYLGNEFDVRLRQLMKQYVSSKYNLHSNSSLPLTKPNPQILPLQSATLNDDFENAIPGPITSSNQVSGWVITSGNHALNGYNSCNLFGCCQQNPNESQIINHSGGGYIDSVIGPVYPINSLFGSNALQSGSRFLRLGSSFSNSGIERAVKTFSVGSNDSLFNFAFMNVFFTGHDCCSGGAFKVNVYHNNVLLSGTSFSITGISTSCTYTNECSVFYNTISGSPATNNTTLIFSEWKQNSIDLSSYIGDTIRIEFIASDCDAGGHYSYSYIDSKLLEKGTTSLPPTLYTQAVLNGQTKSSLGSTLALVSCSVPAVIYLMNQFSYYVDNSNTILTQHSITESFPNTYTLFTKVDAKDCLSPPQFKISNVVNLMFKSAAIIISTNPIICKGETAVLGVSGLYGFKWSTGDTTANIVISPSITTTYSVQSISSEGCLSDNLYFTQIVSDCLGIKNTEEEEAGYSLFPNPASSVITLRTNSNYKEMTFYIENQLGQILFSKNLKENERSICVKGFSPGIYYYKLVVEDKVFKTGKLLLE